MNDTEKIQLVSNAGVSAISTLHESCQALKSKSDLQFDLSETTEIDSSTLQLFIALQKRAESSQADFELVEVSERVKDSMAASGFLDVFPAGSIRLQEN